MNQFAKISAPAKAILCGQHAVVYGEDAIAFAVDIKCHANIYTKFQGNYEPNSITLKINILNQCKSISFNSKVLLLSQSIPKTLVQKYQDFGLKSEDSSFEVFSTKVMQVKLSFEEFSKNIQQALKIEDSTELTSLYKIVMFCQIFSINHQNLNQFLKNIHYIIQTSSQIPIGKGLGSSASFNSVLAASLLVITQILPKKIFLFTSEYKELINYVSRVFEQVQHGRPSGIDNFVSIYGGMVLFNRIKNPHFKNIDDPKILSFLSQNLIIGFVDSGVEKNTKLAVGNVMEKYNLYLQGEYKYKNMISQIGQFPTKIISLFENSQSNEKQIKSKLFQILKLNHMYLRELGLSNKEIEEIVEKYTVEGRSVAKITGAGMGGVVLIVGQKLFVKQAEQNQVRYSLSSQMNTQGLTIRFC